VLGLFRGNIAQLTGNDVRLWREGSKQKRLNENVEQNTLTLMRGIALKLSGGK